MLTTWNRFLISGQSLLFEYSSLALKNNVSDFGQRPLPKSTSFA